MATPSVEPTCIHGLMRMPGFADVVVSRHRKHRRGEGREQRGAVAEIVFVVGAIDGDVAAVNDEMRPLCRDPRAKRRPIRLEMTLARAEMGVRDLDDTNHRAISLPALWCEQSRPHARILALMIQMNSERHKCKMEGKRSAKAGCCEGASTCWPRGG